MDEDGLLSREALDALAAKICSAASAQAMVSARLLRWIGEFDAGGGASRMESGWGGTAGWLQFACSMSPLVAREHVRVARALREMPTVAQLFASGRLSYSKVRAATRLVGHLDEAHLARLATTLTAGELEVSLSTYRRVAGHRRAQQAKRSASWRTDADGFVRVSICLPAEEGALVVAAIEAARDRQPVDQVSTPDAVLDLARTFLDSVPEDVSGADRTSVVVIVDAKALVEGAADDEALDVSAETSVPEAAESVEAGSHDGTCHIHGHGGVEVATAARLACDARRVVGLIVDSDGDVLHHGRAKRLVTAHQRRALTIRDRGMCQYPGCHRRRFLDAHHVVHWARGGASDLENLILLCPAHHTWVHEGGVRISHEPRAGHRWTFRLPDGARVDRETAALTDDQTARLLGWHARRTGVDDRWLPEARRLVPKTGGTPFSLRHAVDALFLMQTEAAA